MYVYLVTLSAVRTLCSAVSVTVRYNIPIAFQHRVYCQVRRFGRTGFGACADISVTNVLTCVLSALYRGADKSLARPERKQATATEDFEFYMSYLKS